MDSPPPAPPGAPTIGKALLFSAGLVAICAPIVLWAPWFLAQSVEIALWALALLLIAAAGVSARDRRKAMPQACMAFAAIVPAVLCEWQWRREHADFHEIVARVKRAGPVACFGARGRAEIDEIARRVRGLEFEPARVVWRGFSTRRNEILDCATLETRRGL